jgi:hypothetical protein
MENLRICFDRIHEGVKLMTDTCQDCGITQLQAITYTGHYLERHHLYPHRIDDNKIVRLVCRTDHNKYGRPNRKQLIISRWRMLLTNDNATKINMELPQDLYDKAKAEAERLTIPLSAFIRQLLVNYFEKR